MEMPVLTTAYCSASRRNNNFRRLTICQHGCRGGTRTHDIKVMSLANSPLFYPAKGDRYTQPVRKMKKYVEQKKGDREQTAGEKFRSPRLFA